jgi:hypothetical protein
MKSEELGYNADGWHDKRLQAAESHFLGILWEDHIGEKAAISALELAVRFQFARSNWRQPDVIELQETIAKLGARILDEMKRAVRLMHNHLLIEHDHVHVFSKAGPGGGYWIAANEEEAKAFYATFRARAMTGLKKAARGNPRKLAEMVTQLSFDFDELRDLTGAGVRATDEHSVVAVDVVDSFLERMTADPDRFSDALRKLGRKYGSVLLPRGQVEAMQRKAAELMEAVQQIAA